MASTLLVQPIKNIDNINSNVNSLNQQRFVWAVDILEGNDSIILEILDAAGTTNLLGEDVQLSYIVPTGAIQQVVVDLADAMFHILVQLQVDYIRYIVRYSQISDQGIEPAKNSSQIVVTLSTLPVHLPNGSNMADYLIKNRGLPPFPIPAAFPLTRFDKTKTNTVWRGFYKSLSFIADEELATRFINNDVLATIKILDGAGNDLATFAPIPILPNDEIKEILINNSSGPLTDTSYPNAKWLSIELASASFTDMPLIIPYLFKIKAPCKPALLLSWFNDRGAKEQFIFERSYTINDTANKGVIYEIPLIEDISTQQDLIGRSSREETQETLLLTVENATQSELKVLAGIKKSRLVWISLDKNDVDRIQVVVSSDYVTPLNVRDSLASYTLQIKLPNNVQLEEILTYSDVG